MLAQHNYEHPQHSVYSKTNISEFTHMIHIGLHTHTHTHTRTHAHIWDSCHMGVRVCVCVHVCACVDLYESHMIHIGLFRRIRHTPLTVWWVFVVVLCCNKQHHKQPDAAGAALDHLRRGGGLGSRPKNMYGERLGDGVEYHLMKPTPRR